MKKLHKKVPLASALRQKWAKGYTLSDLKSDLFAGSVVGMVAIPLGMALAIAIGVPPQYGLYTVMLGGIVSLLGGSLYSVTGPTAAFVVILAPIVHQYGLGGLLLAGFLAGLIIFILGLTKLGQAIRFIPYPVTTGFTSGIAVVIAVIQIKDFFGLKLESLPDAFLEKLFVLGKAAHTFSLNEFLVALSTLFLLILWPRISKKIPSPLFVMSLVTLIVAILNSYYPELSISTIRDRFTFHADGQILHGIPASLPQWNWPWSFSIHEIPFQLSLDTVKSLLLAAMSIAILGAIETLLCAVVADGITQTKHDSDAELLALGVGNIIGPFLGAIPSTGAIVRTATSIRFGAKSPLAAIFHSLIVLCVVVFAADYVSYMPMAALAALLVYVAYGMFDAKHFFHCLNVSPSSDKAVLLACFILTVVFDMVIGVSVGVILAALLFIQRISATTSASQWTKQHHSTKETVPDGVLVYEIAGPLFFGAAQKAIERAKVVDKDIKTVIFNLESVPTMDLTGLVAFESAVLELQSQSVAIHITGLEKQPEQLLKKSKIIKHSRVKMSSKLHEALKDP